MGKVGKRTKDELKDRGDRDDDFVQGSSGILYRQVLISLSLLFSSKFVHKEGN